MICISFSNNKDIIGFKKLCSPLYSFLKVTVCPSALHTTLGLCAGVALEFRPPVTAARLLIKINI